MKRLLAILLMAALLSTQTISASAAEAAATVRLAKTEGTVYVTTKNGTVASISDGMRLYNGNNIASGAKSYAWFNLDDTKSVKLDAASKVELTKSGRKLELKLRYGSLLCDVSSPLQWNESLTVRTSTTITGIRGTIVYFNVQDDSTTDIYVLDGAVSTTATDPNTGAQKTITVGAGEMATSVQAPPVSGQQQVSVKVQPFSASAVAGFVAAEVAANTNLQQRIGKNPSMSVAELVKDADKRLAEEQKRLDIKAAAVEQALKKLADNSKKNPSVTPPTSGGGGGGYSPPSAPVLTGNVTLQRLLDTLSTTSFSTVTVKGATVTVPEETEAVSLPGGKTLSLTNGSTLALDGHDLTVDGTVIVDSDSAISEGGTVTVINPGAMNIHGTLTADELHIAANELSAAAGKVELEGGTLNLRRLKSEGTLSANSGAKLNLTHTEGQTDASFENLGTFLIDGTAELALGSNPNGSTVPFDNRGTLSVSESGDLTIVGGAVKSDRISIDTYGVINNEGTLSIRSRFENHGAVTNLGTLKVEAYQIVDSSDVFFGSLTNSSDGELTLMPDSTCYVSGTLTNCGTMLADGTFTIASEDNDGGIALNETGANLTLQGELQNSGSFTNKGSIFIKGTLSNGSAADEGTLTNCDGATLTIEANGELLNTSTLTTIGNTTVQAGATLSNAGFWDSQGAVTCDGDIALTGTLVPSQDFKKLSGEIYTLSLESGRILSNSDTYPLTTEGTPVTAEISCSYDYDYAYAGSWTALLAATPEEAAYTLPSSVTLTESPVIRSEQNITLKLNGNSIAFDDGAFLINHGSLIVDDSTGTGGINLFLGNTQSHVLQNSGTLTVKGGWIEGVGSCAEEDPPLSDGSIILDGGSIVPSAGNTITTSANSFEYISGTFKGSLTLLGSEPSLLVSGDWELEPDTTITLPEGSTLTIESDVSLSGVEAVSGTQSPIMTEQLNNSTLESGTYSIITETQLTATTP